MAGPTVTVRMYKNLLGDCFLLMLDKGGKRSNILIDCGILQNVPGAKALMGRVADDIVEATGGGPGRPGTIHLLVVTHEHWDHISGFAHAADTFLEGNRLTIEKLWLAWTEKAEDPQASALRDRFDKAKTAIGMAVQHLHRLAADDQLSAVDGLEEFIGPVGEALGASGRLTGRAVMEKLKARAGEDNVAYLEPGQVRTTPGPVGLRAFVLAPPRREDRLFHDLPSAGPKRETYYERFGAAADSVMKSLSLPAWAQNPADGSPFAKRHRTLRADMVEKAAPPDANSSPGFARFWEVLQLYDAESARDRRIDLEWTGVAGHLALKLDRDTNNTSLVLAFELSEGGDVLLFAADAQVGNWLSWHDQDYPAPIEETEGPEAPARVSAKDLLARTLLYKVGHHASHNATLKDLGLGLMSHPALVAMIPVVQEIAETKKGWHMPYPPLLEELVRRTSGRVLRGDRPLGEGLGESAPPPDPAFSEKVGEREIDDPSGAKVPISIDLRLPW